MDAFEQPGADAAKDRRVDFRHLLKIGGRQLNGPARGCRRRCAGWADVPRQRRVEHEAMTFVQRPAERRRVEPNRQLRRDCAHRRLEQARTETTAAVLRRHKHHRNPAAVDIVDPDCRPDDAVIVAGDEAPGWRELDQTAPILEPLIPAHERAQGQRTVELICRQRSNIHVHPEADYLRWAWPVALIARQWLVSKATGEGEKGREIYWGNQRLAGAGLWLAPWDTQELKDCKHHVALSVLAISRLLISAAARSAARQLRPGTVALAKRIPGAPLLPFSCCI